MSELSLHLTSPAPSIDALARRTHPGQAHWAGSGPKGKTCRECKFWQDDGYYAKKGAGGGYAQTRTVREISLAHVGTARRQGAARSRRLSPFRGNVFAPHNHEAA